MQWRPLSQPDEPPLPGSVWKSLREPGEGTPSTGGVLSNFGEDAFYEKKLITSYSLVRASESFRTGGFGVHRQW